MFTLTKINLLWDKVKALTAQVDAMAKIPRGSLVIGLMSGATTIPEAARNEIGDAFKKSIPCFIAFSTSGVFKSMYRVTECYYDITTGALTEIVAIKMKKDAVGHYYIDAKANNSWSASATAVDESGYTPIDYSTTEQDTGLKWIDNRPIYQRTIVVTLPAYNATNGGYLIEENTPPMDKLISVEGAIYDLVSENNMDGSTLTGLSNFTSWSAPIHFTVNKIILIATNNSQGSALPGKTCIVTLKYVKPAPTNETKKKTKKVKEED